jgi:hypothetical protein
MCGCNTGIAKRVVNNIKRVIVKRKYGYRSTPEVKTKTKIIRRH